MTFCKSVSFPFNVVNSFQPVIEKFRESLDQGEAYGAILTDLSKAFDCLHHELHIATLNAYDSDMLLLIQSYLTKRKQTVKINDVKTPLGQKYFLMFLGFNPCPITF